MTQAEKRSNTCRVCLGKAGAEKLMCLRCWRQVPPQLQSDVNRTWRAFNASPIEGSGALLRKYRLAAAAAIEAVRAATTNPNASGESNAHEAR